MALAWIIVPLLATGCLNEKNGAADDDLVYQGPGSEAWGDEDITCATNDDCLSGEACINGICQIDACNGDTDASSPPLAEGMTFYQEAEFGFADTQTYEGKYWVDGYGPSGSSMSYDGSYSAGSSSIVDVTGGNFYGSKGETYATIATDQKIRVLLGESQDTITLSFTPVALDAGDVDGDGMDEAVAIASDGRTAICSVDTGDCEVWSFSSGITGLDVGVGDIDGDTYEEPVLLVEYDGYQYLYAFNPDYEYTGQVEGWSAYTNSDNLVSVDVADLDGDWTDEVIALYQDSCWDWCDDYVQVWSSYEDGGEGSFQMTLEHELDGQSEALDLAAADSDADEEAEVVIVADEGIAMILTPNSSGFSQGSQISLGVSVAPDRVAMADHDGDSPRARLVSSDAQECTGNVVPLMAMVLPPYDKDHANGTTKVGFGDSESSSESMTDTVSLGLGVDVGYSAGFGEVFKAKVSAKVDWRVSESYTTTTRTTIGSRYVMSADPDLYGPYYGGVVLAWGCFDAYQYEIDDPGNVLGSGSDGEKLVMTVPTGGGVSLWSTRRYNAMAAAVGNLPIVEIPYEVGDVDTYPTTAEKLDGSTLTSSDLLFQDVDTYWASDVGEVLWWNSVDETETNSQSMSVEIGASAGITAYGVSVGVDTSQGWGQTYALTVGTSAGFFGGLPAVPDDPDTPEDEHAQNRYGVKPYVYVQDYTDADDNDAGFYVMTYSVER